MAAFLVFIFIVGIAVYIVTAIFLTKVLKRAGHPNPVAAWVPLWNFATMLELAGIAKPWVWVGINGGLAVLASLLGRSTNGAVSGLGQVLTIAQLVLIVMLTVWMARGVQAGLGLNSTGGVVLAVLVFVAWIIWIGLRADKAAFYNWDAARPVGATFPLSKYVANLGS